MLLPILGLIIPVVGKVVLGIVNKAEERFPEPGSGPQKKDWVMGMLTDLWDVLERRDVIPPALLPLKAEFIQMLDILVEGAVAKLNQTQAPAAK